MAHATGKRGEEERRRGPNLARLVLVIQGKTRTKRKARKKREESNLSWNQLKIVCAGRERLVMQDVDQSERPLQGREKEDTIERSMTRRFENRAMTWCREIGTRKSYTSREEEK